LAKLRDLATETAEALLTAIKHEAPKLSGSGLESLANAYAAVVVAMPGDLPAAPITG
jgi:hypothetical protein